MTEVVSIVPSWLSGAVKLFAAGAIGWFASQYMDYRTAYKEALNENYEQFNDATKDLQDSLKQFADIARGAKAKTPEDVEKLQQRLYAAVGVAEDLQRRLRADGEVIDRFRFATVDLKHASDKVTGPTDAKSLVSAVNGYLLAEKELRDAVVSEHNSFLY